MNHLTGTALAAALAVSALAVAPSAAEDAARCSDSVRVVDGAPCFSFGGRLYAADPGDGVEAHAIRGPIAGSLLAGLADVIYRPSTSRFNRTVVIDMGDAPHPAAGTLAVVKLPDRVDGDAAQRVAVRTDTSTGTVRQHASALVNRGRGQLTWGQLSGGHWALMARTPDGWVLFD